jgi:hypothetical protein
MALKPGCVPMGVMEASLPPGLTEHMEALPRGPSSDRARQVVTWKYRAGG